MVEAEVEVPEIWGEILEIFGPSLDLQTRYDFKALQPDPADASSQNGG